MTTIPPITLVSVRPGDVKSRRFIAPAELKAMYAILDTASDEVGRAIEEAKEEPCICGGNHYSREHDCQFLDCDEDCDVVQHYATLRAELKAQAAVLTKLRQLLNGEEA